MKQKLHGPSALVLSTTSPYTPLLLIPIVILDPKSSSCGAQNLALPLTVSESGRGVSQICIGQIMVKGLYLREVDLPLSSE